MDPDHPAAAAVEFQWVAMARRIIEDNEDDDEISGREGSSIASIKAVPRELASAKPEAYAPQLVAMGPYHRHRAELRQMEWQKLAAARAVQHGLPGGVRFNHVVDGVAKHELAVRSHYQRHINMDGEALAWTMAIDASFLLHFLHTFTEKRSLEHAAILSDLLKLENQIPLFLLRHLTTTTGSTHHLPTLLATFLQHVHPFQSTLPSLYPQMVNDPSRHHHHLLHLLYDAVAPQDAQHDATAAHHQSDADLPICPSRSLLCIIISVLVRLIMITNFAPFLFLKSHIEKLREADPPMKMTNDDFEIDVPSASELASAGVTFAATDGGLSTMRFDEKTGTFHLPTITINSHTEVLLRNLVVYEAMTVDSPGVIARYTEIMRGIVDMAEDVRVLRQCGVIVCKTRKAEAVAEMWNGMSWSERRIVGEDEAVVRLRMWYDRRWKVRVGRMVKRGRLDFSKVSSFLFLGLVVVLVSMHVYCFLHHCGG